MGLGGEYGKEKYIYGQLMTVAQDFCIKWEIEDALNVLGILERSCRWSLPKVCELKSNWSHCRAFVQFILISCIEVQ